MQLLIVTKVRQIISIDLALIKLINTRVISLKNVKLNQKAEVKNDALDLSKFNPE